MATTACEARDCNAPRLSLLDRVPILQPAATAADHDYLVQHIPEILFGDSPGACLSGAPGSGKSNTLEILLRAVVHSPLQPGLLFLDPHGTSAKKFYRWCLDQGKSVANRVLYLHFANTTKIPSIDVLHVPGDDIGSIGWYGRLAFVTELVSKILLAAWGETDFNSKPILFKNTFRVNYTLAHAGLPLADSKMFGDIHAPIYRTLCQAVPDVIPTARSDMLRLPDLRESDQIAQLESWRNRTFGLLSNPVFEAIVSRTAADGALTMQQLYDDRLIVIANVETGGVLRTMDQEIIANALLTLAIYTAMNTPEEHRHLQVLAIDELPIFKSSADLLTTVALPQCRKYFLRTIACFQGATAFADGTEDRLLNAFLSLCGARLYFRHNSDIDCALFGRSVAMPSYSPLLIKHQHAVPMQFNEGHEAVTLTDTSDTVTDGNTEAEAQATGTSNVNNWNDTTGSSDTETFRDAVRDARAKAKSRQAARGGAHGTTQQNTVTRARTRSQAHSITRKTQLVPIINTKDVITSVEFFTKDELDAMAAAIVANQRVGQAILHVSGSLPVQVTFPFAADPFGQIPKFGKKTEGAHLALLQTRPEFATFAEIQEQRQLLREALLRRLEALLLQRLAGQLTHAEASPADDAEPVPLIIDTSSPLAI